MIRSPIARTGTLKPARTRKCAVKGCGNRFQPRNMAHKVCGPDCSAVFAVAERKRLDAKQARQERAQDKAKREAMKNRNELIAEAQEAFNLVVRLEDADLPCISCGATNPPARGLTGGVWDAGHYLSRGSACHLRFDRRNVHKQCKGCNRPSGTTRAETIAALQLVFQRVDEGHVYREAA